MIEGETLYVGTREGTVVALDPQTGDTRWRFDLPTEDRRDRAVYGEPAVVGDTVYVGAYDGVLYALSSTGGELLWQEAIGEENEPIVAGPVVVGDLILISSSDDNLYALDFRERTLEWRFQTGNSIWSTPVVESGVAYFGSQDGSVYAVRIEDGTKVWEFETDGAVNATPLLIGDTLYFGSFDKKFYAVDARSGLELWRFDDASNWFWGEPAANENLIFAPSLDGNLYALDINTGQMIWTLETDGPIVGRPAIVGDKIAVASNDGRVRLVRLGDGAELFSCNIEKDIQTPLVENDGLVYFGADDDRIYALSIKPDGNPDEVWAHNASKDDPIERDRAKAC